MHGLFKVLFVIWAFSAAKRHHSSVEFCDLVDWQGDNYSNTLNMVTKTKQARRDEKQFSALGTGRARIKVLFQNGGNVQDSYPMMEQIENMLDSVRPHILFMAENRMDEKTRSRLTNQHGFSVEELGPGERVWAAVKNTVPYLRRREYEIPGVCALWLEFGQGSKKYIIVGAYREFKRIGEKDGRSRENQKKRWTKLLDKVNEVINNRNIELHLMGDLNLDLNRWPQLGSLKKGWEWTWFVNEMYDKLMNGSGMGLSDTGGSPTWWNKDRTRSSIIDIHLTNRPDRVKNVTTSYEFHKDHASLIMERAEADVLGDAIVTKRNWKAMDYVWMKCMFWEHHYWTLTPELCHVEDPDEINDRLVDVLNELADLKWPVKTFKIKPAYAPYISRPLRDLRKVKRRLWNEFKKTGNNEVYKEMRSVTNKLRQKTKSARKRWFGRKMGDYKNSEGLWKYARVESNWKQDEPPSTIIKDGVRYTNPVDVANAINDEMIKKVKDILETIPDDGTDPLSYTREWLQDKHVPVLELTKTASQEEVEAALASLNITDAAGHDNLTTRLIKEMREPLACIMTHLVNQSFKYDKYPTAWKLAKISPLYKKGDKFDARNYRPVAVLPALSKVMEKVVIGRLKTHLEKNRLLSDHQNAYRERRSVTTAVIQLYDEILKMQDLGTDSGCVFLDCSAAFDTITHSVLLDKLKLYGVDDKGLRWCKDYLSDRAQYVSIGGQRSDIKKIMEGAFQGSIGGPWAFLVMINDIVVLCKAGSYSIFIYADDTCLRINLSGDIEEDQRRINEIIKDVVRYMNATKLRFNFSKTEFVVTAPKRHDDYKDLVLSMDGATVKQKLHARLLGLQVSWDLTHNWFVAGMKENLIASLKKRLFILRSLRNKCPKKCLKNLAHGLVYSKLNFGIQYWSQPLPDIHWKKIEVILNDTAREVLKVRPLQVHVLDLYRVLDWLPAKSCRDYHDLNLFWSIKHHQIPLNLGLMLRSHQEEGVAENRRMTRSVTQHSINRSQENDSVNAIRTQSFIPRMVKTFNELEPAYKSLPDLRDKWGNPLSDQLKFADLRVSLRRYAQERDLGPRHEWPSELSEILLDRADEIYGLGILSDDKTSSSDDEKETVTT